MDVDLAINLFRALMLSVAIWVAVDAHRLGARRGVLGGGMLDIGPVAWFFCMILGWIIALPCYLATRPRLVEASRRRTTMPGGSAPASYGFFGPHPGGAPAPPVASPFPAQSYPTQPYPTQPYPTQPYPTQPYPAQPHPAQSYPAQPYPAQPSSPHRLPPKPTNLN